MIVWRCPKMGAVLRSAWRETRRGGGFSMSEVLLAMGVFAIGFVAVAAIFPVATVMQKQAVEKTMSDIVLRNAIAVIKSQRLIHDDGDPSNDLTGTKEINPRLAASLQVQHMRYGTTGPIGNQFLNTARRSYPDMIGEPTVSNSFLDLTVSGYYWVPLVRRTVDPTTTPDEYEFYLFVLRRDEAFRESPVTLFKYQKDYDKGGSVFSTRTSLDWATKDDYGVPSVKRIALTSYTLPSRLNFTNTNPQVVFPGDKFLDSNGTIHRAISADSTGCDVAGTILVTPTIPDEIWVGYPGSLDNAWDDHSPTVDVVGPILGMVY